MQDCKVCGKNFKGEAHPTIVICGVVFCSDCITRHSLANSWASPAHDKHISSSGVSTSPASDVDCRSIGEASRTSESTDVEVLKSKAPGWISSDATNGLSDKMVSLRQEQSHLVDDSVADCNDMLSELDGYSTSLEDLMLAHGEMITKLKDFVKHHQDVQKILKQSQKSVKAKQQEGEDHYRKMQLASEQLGGASSASEVGSAIDKADREMNSLIQWIHECRNLFPDTKAVYRSIRVQKATKTAMELMTPKGEPFPRLMDSLRMQVAFNENYSISDTMKKMAELMNVSQSMKELVEIEQIVAIWRQNDCFRYAKITRDGDNFCLHHLQGEPPADYAFTVQFDGALARAIDTGLAFLDLSFAGSSPRRVYVRMDPQKNIDLAKQFLYMCTGASGTSFADTVLHIENQGQDQEMLVGGDYDGQGGTSIFPGLTAEEVEEPWTEGLVGGFKTTSDSTGTKFFITTKNSTNNSNIRYVFGTVEKDLDVAKEAAQSDDKDVIKVVDCGVVL